MDSQTHIILTKSTVSRRHHIDSSKLQEHGMMNSPTSCKPPLKYAQEILKKHGMTSCDNIGTPMATKSLDVDLSGIPVDQTKYHSMVGALMYLTASRPDIVHAICYCAHYQARPTKKHLNKVKRIFRYLKNTIHMRLWYPKNTDVELTAFLDSDHTGCFDIRKNTFGGMMRFLALGWLLEEIHVTWAHLEKKRTRLRTYTKSHDDFCKQWLETTSQA
ncbi:hypothetical protein Tco_1398438 [Tanacetum coccineum]